MNYNEMNNTREAVLDIENTATHLGISTATVRNWVKCGYLRTLGEKTKYFFDLKEVENIKSNIANGNLDKLSKRANKSKAERTFIPEEYVKDKSGLEQLNRIIEFIKHRDVDLSLALLLVSLALLKKEGIISEINIEDITQRGRLILANKQIGEEINSWLSEIKKENIKLDHLSLLDFSLPKQRDILGFIYQSLLLEGKKAKTGSYYTPSNIVDEIIKEYAMENSKVLDPCCGTGQFLLAFSEVVKDPLNIYGVDVDKMAVRIARLNILIKYKDRNFTPNVICRNTLFDIGNYDLFSLNDENIRDFDVIATNPPWGIHFLKEEIEKLKESYPRVYSFESFSYFIKKSVDLLRDNGVLSFILPESILNVRTHRDIREIILSNTNIKKIIFLDRIFKNVFTPVIRLDLKKSKKESNRIKVFKENENYGIEQSKWKNNQSFIFDIHANGFDTEIIEKVYKTPHTTLEGRADWALGIVTGNNSKYITSEVRKGFEEVFKGKDVGKFVLSKPTSYIKFAPEKFQQVAPIEKYTAPEKLIYRFISKYLVFAYDDKQRLTLNSANIVIPDIPGYPIKVIAALFNSSLYQFIFQKKFSSIKVLRSHIEQMPLPLWDQKTFNEIIGMVDLIIKDKFGFEKLDDYIINRYFFSLREKNYIQEV